MNVKDPLTKDVKMSMINPNIFNEHKTDYDKPSLFLGEKMGLLDSIHDHYPDILDLYYRQGALTWSPLEFDFKPCAAEFKQCSKSTYDMMLLTLRWQWEMDTIVARSITSTTTPFISSSELSCAWALVAATEQCHSLCYSEIVKNSFDDPNLVLKETLEVKESLARLETVSRLMSYVYDASNRLAANMLDKDKAYDAIFLYVIVVLAIERIHFMASFAITFAIADTGLFTPIGKAVQKICQDEFEIHVQLDKAILRHELKTARGQQCYKDNLPLIKNILDEVIDAEFTWTDFLFSEGRELVGMTPKLLKEWVLWCAKDVFEFLDINSEFKFPQTDPLPFMNDWIKNDQQPSPQEEKPGAYMLGMVKDNTGEELFDDNL